MPSPRRGIDAQVVYVKRLHVGEEPVPPRLLDHAENIPENSSAVVEDEHGRGLIGKYRRKLLRGILCRQIEYVRPPVMMNFVHLLEQPQHGGDVPVNGTPYPFHIFPEPEIRHSEIAGLSCSSRFFISSLSALISERILTTRGSDGWSGAPLSEESTS